MFSIKAVSWDTQPRLPYNRNAPRNPNKKPKSETDSVSLKTTPQTVSLTAESVQTKSLHVSVTELLKKRRNSPQETIVNSDNSYHGYEQWLPSPPKVEKPRSLYNAASLAYIGDCIYEFYARRHFLFPPLNIEEHNDRVQAVVRCEAQDELLQKLLADNHLSEEERDILRWGKNVGAGKSRTKKRVGAALYNRASSLETLIGYLYLTNVKRLEDVMFKLGFSTGVPMESA